MSECNVIACGHLTKVFKEIRNLKDENAKLIEEMRSMEDAQHYADLNSDIELLKMKNTRLLEKIKDMENRNW